MDKADFVDLVLANPINRAVLERLPEIDLPDAWLVSGALFQTAWNGLTGRPPQHGIKDYDVFYYDGGDLSWEAEDKAITKAAMAFKDLDADIEVRNQARVHLWYPKKFGQPYPPLASACEGIDRFLAVACMVGLQLNSKGEWDLYAPRGLEDLATLYVRPNHCANFQARNYQEKADRWKQEWPELTVVIAEDDKAIS